MDGKNRRHASSFSVGIPIRPLAPQWTSGGAIENVALRMQIAAFQQKRKRPQLTTLDRAFWITLRTLNSDWRHPLIYIPTGTVVRWQRERFRRFWATLSKPQRRRRGRSGPPQNFAD
jgi:hypothetical protein